ncbi:MAG: type II toxin-antitoxin system VapC family toxin [Pyrinomonadaceae bacterium]
MAYLLDTCVLSEYKKLIPNAKVIDWLESQSDELLFLSVLTIGELEKGIVKMPVSKRKNDLEAFVETLLVRFDRSILGLDTAILRRWGIIMGRLETEGRPIPVIDSLMAVTALEHDLTIVTRNEEDFAPTGVKVLNLWR